MVELNEEQRRAAWKLIASGKGNITAVTPALKINQRTVSRLMALPWELFDIVPSTADEVCIDDWLALITDVQFPGESYWAFNLRLRLAEIANAKIGRAMQPRIKAGEGLTLKEKEYGVINLRWLLARRVDVLKGRERPL